MAVNAGGQQNNKEPKKTLRDLSEGIKGEIERQIFEDLCKKIYDDVDDLKQRLGINNNSVQVLEKEMKKLDKIKTILNSFRDDLTKRLQGLEESYGIYNREKEHITNRIENTRKALEGISEEITNKLLKDLKKYNNLVKQQESKLKSISEKVIDFQKLLSEELNIKIIISYSTSTTWSFALYSKLLPTDIIDKPNSSGDLKISSPGIQAVMNRYEQSNKQLFKEIEKSLTNLENGTVLTKAYENLCRAYTNISKNIDDSKYKMKDLPKGSEQEEAKMKQNKDKEALYVRWYDKESVLHVLVCNRGIIEESRQKFLLQIHLKEIRDLFSEDPGETTILDGKTIVANQMNSTSKTIDNFMRYDPLGVMHVDNTSGLIVDDFAIKIKQLSKEVREYLNLSDSKYDDIYASFAIKTSGSNLTSEDQLLKIFQAFQGAVSTDMNSLERLCLKLKKDFFMGKSITREVEDTELKKIKVALGLT